jgi:radical SAM superfamily enzyme YgiQ (UPF0313 family)
MDLLLTHGYFIADDEHEQQIMKPYPPLGLLYISSHLKEKGFEVNLFDSTFYTMTDFKRHLQDTRPPVVGISCNLLTKQRVLDQIRACKEVGAHVVLGGPEPVSYAEMYLKAGADVVVSGEGEMTLEELIPTLASKGPQNLRAVNGLVYLDAAGMLVRTPARAPIEDLTAQPWPDREEISIATMQHGRDTIATARHRLSPPGDALTSANGAAIQFLDTRTDAANQRT